MKRKVLTIIVCSSWVLAAGVAFADQQQTQSKQPTSAEIQQEAMQDGPSTSRIGYLTHMDPAAPHHAAAPVNPKLLRPLTQDEIGMLYYACVAYPECVTAYSHAYEHNQALLRAQKTGGASGQ